MWSNRMSTGYFSSVVEDIKEHVAAFVQCPGVQVFWWLCRRGCIAKDINCLIRHCFTLSQQQKVAKSKYLKDLGHCGYRFSWKPIWTYMSLTLARLCGEWWIVLDKILSVWIFLRKNYKAWSRKSKYSSYEYFDDRWRNWKAIEEIRKPLKKSESHWRNRKAIEEIGKPLKKIFSDFLEIGKVLNRWRKSNFEQGKFGVSFWHQIFYHVCAWIYLIGFSVFQLLITLAFQMK